MNLLRGLKAARKYTCHSDTENNINVSNVLERCARGTVVVKALCYKTEGHGFDTR
jgi:hypothetical protein